MITEAPAVYPAQIEELQCITHEIRRYKYKYLRIEVAVVAQSARHQVRHGRRARQAVIRIDRSGINRDLIVQRGMRRIECQRQILCLAVATRHRESDISAAIPSVHQPGME